MDSGPEKLTVDAARQLTFKATAPARTTEETLYDTCVRAIRREACKGATCVACTIPRFLFGLPLYSQRIMRDRVAMRFEREGFVVTVQGAEGLVVGGGPGAWGGGQRKSAPTKRSHGKTPGVRGQRPRAN